MSEAPSTCKAVLRLANKHGLHARPAHMWVQTANSFASRLIVRRVDGGEEVDGKSIMGIMMLAAEHGSELAVESSGPDCEAQVRALRELVEAGFGEE